MTDIRTQNAFNLSFSVEPPSVIYVSIKHLVVIAPLRVTFVSAKVTKTIFGRNTAEPDKSRSKVCFVLFVVSRFCRPS